MTSRNEQLCSPRSLNCQLHLLPSCPVNGHDDRSGGSFWPWLKVFSTHGPGGAHPKTHSAVVLSPLEILFWDGHSHMALCVRISVFSVVSTKPP